MELLVRPRVKCKAKAFRRCLAGYLEGGHRSQRNVHVFRVTGQPTVGLPSDSPKCLHQVRESRSAAVLSLAKKVVDSGNLEKRDHMEPSALLAQGSAEAVVSKS